MVLQIHCNQIIYSKQHSKYIQMYGEDQLGMIWEMFAFNHFIGPYHGIWYMIHVYEYVKNNIHTRMYGARSWATQNLTQIA